MFLMKILLFEKIVKLLSSFLNLFASVSLVAMMLLTCMDVSMRYFFNRPLAGIYDIVSLLGVFIAAFALPYTLLKGGHVAVDLLVRILSPKKRLVVETATHVVGIGLFLILSWQSFLLASDMKAVGEVMPTLLLPFHPIVNCMAVCFLGLCLAILVDIFDIWSKKGEK
jgi:TRAP-type C4-dicarboxylate transport system permease small subunit